MYRITTGMPDAERDAMRRHVRNYTKAVISQEWPVQRDHHGTSAEARRQLDEIYREYRRLPADIANSAINSQFLSQFATVTTTRNHRTLNTHAEVPLLLWVGLIIGAFIVIGMSTLLSVEDLWPHVIATASLGLVIGLLFFVIEILAEPFSGAMAIGPDAFQHALVVYDAVDRGA
jgi:hypothetical protein